MLFKTKRRAIIILLIIFLATLYFSNNVFVAAPFFIAIIALVLLRYVDRSFKFNFPEKYYILVFIALFLGTIVGGWEPPFGFFYRFVFYDKLLHFLIPFLLSAIMFFMLDSLKIKLKWKLLMTFGIVFGMLGVHEIGEYLSDRILGTIWQGVYIKDFSLTSLITHTQVQDPLDDTMQDMIYGLLGIVAFTIYKTIQRKIKKKR